jgi:hypothetical protein
MGEKMKIKYSHRNIMMVEDIEGHWKKIYFRNLEDINRFRTELNKVEEYLKGE